MKFGKEFQQILADPHFPDEWKSSAIEYRQLKKLIKDVVSELSDMGLSPDVLNKLLISEDGEPGTNFSEQRPTAIRPSRKEERPSDDGRDQDDILEFEFESDESPPSLHPSRMLSPRQPVDPILDDSGDSFRPYESYQSRSMEAGPSSLGLSQQKKFRVRLLSESKPPAPDIRRDSDAGPRPMSVAGMLKDVNGPDLALRESVDGSLGQESFLETHVGGGRGRRVIRRSMNEGKRVKAEYLLGGDSQHPQPQLVLHLPASSSISSRNSSSARSRTISSESEQDEDEEDEDDIANRLSTPIRSAPLLYQSVDDSPATIRAKRSPPEPPDIDIIPPSPRLQRVRTALSPIFALASSGHMDNGMRDLSLGESAIEDDDDETPLASLGADQAVDNLVVKDESIDAPAVSDRDRDIVIPLASDQAFFNLLTTALTSLSAFHSEQQEQFRQSVSHLCGMISSSIQPPTGKGSYTVLPTPLTSNGTLPSSATPASLISQPHAKPSKKDLYAWREIFTLWIEAEIFESSAERTRGERTVEQAETRLQGFANEVIKRGLGDRRTLRGKKSRGAWEEFLRLNVLLLDLKRFQMANINAARKILKKHDKRTALTASTGFQSFVRSTLSAVGSGGNITTWTFYNTSLPHVLLASLTDTLLPILPSLDDYACLICTSIAFKPIRLSCQHLFCVRCLVKMQRAGKAECPLCRSKVVLLADKSSLDVQVMDFMKEWFPKEVKAKQRENDDEIHQELVVQAQAGAVHPGNKECLIM